MEVRLPESVKYIIERLRSAGYRADAVGGAVRDLFLGRDCDDYDVTTVALPEEVKCVFEGERIIETGIKHGTVTLLLDGVGYEITTYRVDGEYLDSRHPETVSFTADLKEDLRRRDFTMNAICYNHFDGFFDPFGGVEDIERGIIRAVGEPAKRFSEDALRIMRAVRFSSVLGFAVEEQTDRALRELAPTVSTVSRERIYTEWLKLLGGKDVLRVLADYRDVLCEAIPELKHSAVPPFFTELCDSARFPALFAHLGGGGGEIFSRACHYLKTDRETEQRGASALALLDTELDSLRALRHAVKERGLSAVVLAVELLFALGREGNTPAYLTRILDEHLPCTVKELAIGGKELMALGLSGRAVGDCLDRLISAVIDGETENEREVLLSFVARTAP